MILFGGVVGNDSGKKKKKAIVLDLIWLLRENPHSCSLAFAYQMCSCRLLLISAPEYLLFQFLGVIGFNAR